MHGSFSQPAPATVDPHVAAVAYGTFNVLIFAVMVVFSYVYHDDLLLDVFKWRRALASAKNAFHGAYAAYARAYARRTSAHAKFLSRSDAVATEVRRLVEAYRKANLRARKDRGQAAGSHYPRCFDKCIYPEIPAEFRAIGWQAPEEARTAFATMINNEEIRNAIDISDHAISDALGVPSGAPDQFAPSSAAAFGGPDDRARCNGMRQ